MMTLFTLQLIVPLVSGGFGLTCSAPTLEAEEGEDVTLCCEFDSVNLMDYTVDVSRNHHRQIVHLYRHGKDQPDAQVEQYTNRTTLDHKELGSGSIRLKISSVMKSDSGNYTCNVPRLKLKSSVTLDVVEKKIHHSAAPPQENNSTSDQLGKDAVGVGVGAVVALCVLIPVVVLIVVGVTSGRIKTFLTRCRGQRDRDADPMELVQVVTERERETDTERERDRERDRQTERERERQRETDRQTDRQRERHRQRETETEREREDLLNHHSPSPLDTNEQEH